MPPSAAETAKAVSFACCTLWPTEAVPRSLNATAFQLEPQRPRCSQNTTSPQTASTMMLKKK